MKMPCQIRIGAALALRYWKVAAGRLPCWRERWRGGFLRARDVGAEPGNHVVYSVLGRRSFLLWAPLLAHQYKVGAIVQVYSFLSPQSSQPRTVVRDAVPRCTMLCLGIPCHAKPCCAMQSQLNMGIIYLCFFLLMTQPTAPPPNLFFFRVLVVVPEIRFSSQQHAPLYFRWHLPRTFNCLALTRRYAGLTTHHYESSL